MQVRQLLIAVLITNWVRPEARGPPMRHGTIVQHFYVAFAVSRQRSFH